jgi:sialate O-acetylesterase
MKPIFFQAATSLLMLVSVAPTHARESMPLVHPLFTDHAVIQRDAKVPVWGWGTPGSEVSVRFAGQAKTSNIASDGRWTVTLDPMPATSEGQILEVRSDQENAIIREVLVGDVWICSGQSNMEMGIGLCNEEQEVAKADFPHIRLLTVPRKISFSPEEVVDADWLPCNPENLEKGVWGGFSAAAYFFGRELHRELGVPVGLIHASWGGSPCQSWTSGDSLAPMAFYQSELAQVSEVASLPGSNRLDDFMDRWYREKDPGTRGKWIESDADASSWTVVAMPATWSASGLSGHEGIVWLRRTFDIPASWQGKDLVLDLGPIADVDTTWINGQIVGRCDSYEVSRSYTAPTAAVRPGRNVIAVRVMNQGGGGFSAKPEAFLIRPKDEKEAAVSLAGSWHLRATATRAQTGAPLAGNPGTPSVLYNGMMAPLLPFSIKGAIWYQGEANTNDPARYRVLLPALIRDWRKRFGSGDFPFHIVSLANYQPPSPGDDDGWPELREAQAMTAKQVPNCGLAVAIDIGDASDIHPKNKREVGRRLALSALAKTYGRPIEGSGPWYRSMEITDNRVRLTFDHSKGGLLAKGDHPTGFTIAGEDRKFVAATALIEGETVVVSTPTVSKPVAVRYGWSANPACNLHNEAGLPAVPFRTDDWPSRKP